MGSHGYHELIGIDANEPFPTICPASPCPAVYPTVDPSAAPPVTIATGFPNSSPLAGAAVPAGTYYIPVGRAKANSTIANTWTWFSLGDSSYNALQLDVNHRMSHGVSIRGAYTWSKSLDDGDSLNASTAANAPGLVANPFDIRSDRGPATYDVRNIKGGERALRAGPLAVERLLFTVRRGGRTT